jgi:hypothetical protein
MSHTVSLRSSSKKAELKKKLDDGDISYSYDLFRSTFVDDNHDSVIDSWISTYSGGDSQKKDELNNLKKRKVGSADGFFKGVVRNGMKVRIFALKFTAKNKDGDRTYYQASANIELASADADAKKLINAHFHDLAILALTGGSDSYTITAE